MEFINYCDKNRILLAIYPPHSTHTLQPLDVGMFKPLSTQYSNQLASFLEKNQGTTRISKRNFWRIFFPAFKAAFTQKNIESSWQAVGLVPFDPEVILRRFQVPERPSSSGSNASALSASDWRKVRAILEEIVDEAFQVEQREVLHAVCKLSAEAAILRHENKGLREALVQEKKKRKRHKVLPLLPKQDYHGGAVLYSPNKVQEARDRVATQEATEAEEKRQKSEEAIQKAIAKAAKKEALEMRRQQRADAKEMRLQEEERKRREREATKLRREQEAIRKAEEKETARLDRLAKAQLRWDTQMAIQSQKSPKKKPQPRQTAKNVRKEIPVFEISDDNSPTPTPSSPLLLPAQTRRGRTVKLPERFLDT
jgi:hypothetical protein